MARISEQELGREIESWRAALSKIDESVKTPDSLRGAALRRKLDALPAPKEERLFQARQLLSFRSVVSYAVMFALIIAVYYGVRGGSKDQLTDGEFTVYDSAASQKRAMLSDPVAGGEEAEPEMPAAPPASSQDAEPSLFSIPLPEGAAAEQDMGEAADILPAPKIAPFGIAEDNLATGGGGQSMLLGEWNGYVMSWRYNDPADPEKHGAVTVEAAARDASIAFQVDVPDMTEISDFLIDDDVFILIGRSRGMGVVQSYSGLTGLAPVFTGTVLQPGTRIATRLYQGVVYTVSFSEEGENPDNLALQPLDGSLDAGVCYITALNVSTGETGILGLERSGSDISLFDRHVYVSFNGPASAGGGTEVYVAQVALENTNIMLSGIH